MSSMQKRFIHERLKHPDSSDPASGVLNAFRVFCESHFLFRKSPDYKNFEMHPLGTFPTLFTKLALLKEGYDPNQWMSVLTPMYEDGSLAALSLISGFFFHGKPRSFVFAQEFWPALRKTKLSHISWDMLPQTFTGTFRFPDPIIDNDGDPIHEVMMTIQPRSVFEHLRRQPYTSADGEGSRVLSMWWLCSDAGGSTGYSVHLIPDGPAPILPESWEPQQIRIQKGNPFKGEATIDHIPMRENSVHVAEMIKALFYVCSGDPDIRSERNRIIYKPGTQNPIAVHREFSTQPYEKVGWNWMKKLQQRRYSKEGWMVEPHARYQPYGPRENPSYRWIIVEGHERHRRVPLADKETPAQL